MIPAAILLTVQSFLRRIWPCPPGEIFGTHCSSRCSCLPCARTDRPSRLFPRGWIARTRAQNRGRPPSFWRRLCSLQPWPSRRATGRLEAGRPRSDTRTQLHRRGRLLLRWVCKKKQGVFNRMGIGEYIPSTPYFTLHTGHDELILKWSPTLDYWIEDPCRLLINSK